MNALAIPVPKTAELNNAFNAFVAAAGQLERSHVLLHTEVSELRAELEQRNTELAESLATNQAMREELRQILDALPCGVVVLNGADHNLVLVNPEAKRMIGFDCQSPEWNEISDQLRAIVAAAMSTPDHTPDSELAIQRDTTKRWLSCRFATMRHSTDVLQLADRFVLILRDVTVQRQAHEEREHSRRLFALAEVATVLAHEIRNPLGSLELMANLLDRDPKLNETCRKYVNHMQAGIRTLCATVNNTLAYHGPASPCLELINIADVLDSALDFVRPMIEQSGVTLHIENCLNDVQLNADASRVHQVVLNLVCNSLRHTPSGGTLNVLAEVDSIDEKQILVVEFSDTGTGISPNHLPHIFEPGFSSTKQSPGLGLTVCKQIMDEHGGTISAESEVDKGATFRLEFPLK